MKRKALVMTTALLLMLATAMVLNGQDAQAANRKKVKATIKGSTLTISGKGAMSPSLKIKKSKRKKVKKIVVKKGVTSIPANAFAKYKNVTSATVAKSVKKIGQNAFHCEKLKKLTIPGKFEMGSGEGAWISGRVNTVTFNTNLDIKRAAAFDANNLVVKKSDPKYKSINGVIYSRDGKAVVRVPFQRSGVVLAEGCEVFCLQSVMYCNVDDLEDPFGGCRVQRIVIPASVKEIESDRYYAMDDRGLERRTVNGRVTGLQVDVQGKQLKESSLSQLIHILGMDMDSLMKQLPDQISKKDDMYITNTYVLLAYGGKDSEIKIPAGIKKIGDYVFDHYRGMTGLVLPEGLQEIGKDAFRWSSSGTYIKKLILPDSLVKIGNGAFKGTGIEEIQFGKGIKEIGDEAFMYTDLKNLTIPAAVTKIGKQAFGEMGNTDILIQGSSAGFSDQAFRGQGSLIFEKGPGEQRVSFYIPGRNYISKKKMKVSMAWVKVKEADGYEIVTATNAKFTKNKNRATVKGSLRTKILTMKGKFKKSMKVYIKMRPYSYLDGKKNYGRWSQAVAEDEIESSEDSDWLEWTK